MAELGVWPDPRHPGGVVLHLDPVLRRALDGLVGALIALLDSTAAGERPPSAALATPSAPGAVPDTAWLAAATGLGGADPGRPQDPAVLRLLPDGYPLPSGSGASRAVADTQAPHTDASDVDPAAEFRRLTEGDLRSARIDGYTRVQELLRNPHTGPLTADPDTLLALQGCLHDVRLVLSERLATLAGVGTAGAPSLAEVLGVLEATVDEATVDEATVDEATVDEATVDGAATTGAAADGADPAGPWSPALRALTARAGADSALRGGPARDPAVAAAATETAQAWLADLELASVLLVGLLDAQGVELG